MSNYYEHCFFRIDFDVIPSYIEFCLGLSNTLLLADEFENFWNMYLEIDEVDPAHFLAAPRFASQAALKKTKVKLDLLTDIDVIKDRESYQGRNMLLCLLACKN